MTHKEYNGWYNYETWAVSLWMDNDEGTQDFWRGRAKEIAEDESIHADTFAPMILTEDVQRLRKLEDEIKSSHEESLPELDGFAGDLLNDAMSEVNWREIAKHLMDEVKQEAAS